MHMRLEARKRSNLGLLLLSTVTTGGAGAREATVVLALSLCSKLITFEPSRLYCKPDSARSTDTSNTAAAAVPQYSPSTAQRL